MTETNETEQSLRDELIATNAALDAMGELYKRACAKRDEERARANKAEARVKFLSDLRNNIAIERDRAENKVDSLTTRVADLEEEVRRLQRALEGVVQASDLAVGFQAIHKIASDALGR